MSLARKLQALFLLIQRPVKARMTLLLGDDLDHCELDQPTGELNTRLFHSSTKKIFYSSITKILFFLKNIAFFIQKYFSGKLSPSSDDLVTVRRAHSFGSDEK